MPMNVPKVEHNRIQIALTTAFRLGAKARFDVRFACYSGANADTMGFLSGLFSSQPYGAS